MTRRFVWRMFAFFCVGLLISSFFISQAEPQEKTPKDQKPVEQIQLGDNKNCNIESVLADSQSISDESKISNYALRRDSDRLLQRGATAEAKKLLQSIGNPFPRGTAALIPPTRDVDKISDGARLYWRNGEAGLKDGLETQALISLGKLSDNYPEFIPGHVKFAEAALRWNQPEKAIATLDRAYEFYPDRVDIVEPLLQLLKSKGMLVEASIAARQFGLNYPEHPDAAKYKKISEENINQFLDDFKKDTIVTGILSGDAKLIDMIKKGESGYGETLAEESKSRTDYLSKSSNFLEYLNKLGQKLAKFAGRDDFKYEFYVVRDKSLNAFALPGGKIFINLGTIADVESEAELAGILSHEIAHAVFSHGYLKVTTDVKANLLKKIPLISDFFNLVKPELAFSRALEKQSDLLGTRILASSGYSADGLYRVFERWRKYDKKTGTNWLDTHPASIERMQYLAEIITSRNYERYSLENVEALAEARMQLCSDEKIAQAEIAARKAAEEDKDRKEGKDTKNGSQIAVNLGNTNSNLSPETKKTETILNSGTANEAPKPKLADQTMIAALTREDVTIILRNVDINPSGYFVMNVEITNNSKADFGFVPGFVRVINADGKALRSAFTGDKAKPLVSTGETIKAKLKMPGQVWKIDAKQNLILEIKEGTIGARVFRIPF